MTRRCVVCGASLPEQSRSDRRTCSAKCRVALSRRLKIKGIPTSTTIAGVTYLIEPTGQRDALGHPIYRTIKP